ncbi:type VI secretion system tube protein Hcp [Belnapia sp. T6]|uniref:Type VI secretion system tube protein Hcp n=1 Tax=Belnapia mucosa TaxID=2804532 RepID=A0ABS1VAE5_9PROT|nr:type VI secretion system tube protein Hcp [Belnapia mucosa]MBL6458649.1 type VI secretion system tube protein Hcp [Belnapia mucosa]
MSHDIFIKIEGAKGEAKDGAHKEEIDVLAWNWGMSQSGSRHVGGGGGTGKVTMRDMHFVHYIDKATPNLMLFCCNGKHIPSAELTVRKAGEKPVEYMKVKMTDVLVASIDTGGSGEQERLTETVNLNFAKVEVEYTPQKADGSGEAPATMGWDVAKNEKV